MGKGQGRVNPASPFVPGCKLGGGKETQFKAGVYNHARSTGHTFTKGHYYGYPSREAWAASFKGQQKMKRDRMKAVKRHTDIVKEARQIQDMAREMAPEVLDAMKGILQNENSTDVAKIAAGNVILERAYGKPLQTNVNATVNTDGKPAEVDGQELDRRIASALERVERLTQREAKEGPSEERPSDVRFYN